MSFYRVKQFILGFTSLFKEVDYDYLNKFLNKEELKLFDKLKHSDKHHCIRVCKDSIKMKEDFNINVDSNKLAKAALLHDIGKSKNHLNLVEKSLVVLMDKITSGEIKKYNNIKQIDIYYNHPKIGLNMLNKYNYDKEFLQVIRYHHNKDKFKKNKILNIISECDNKN